MHYFVCVHVSVAVITWKLGGMEEILNGAEPDSATSAWISRELWLWEATLTLAYVSSSGNDNPMLWQEKTVSIIECKSEIGLEKTQPRWLLWQGTSRSPDTIPGGSCMPSSCKNFSQEELQEIPINLVNQGLCLQPEKLDLNTVCIWTKSSGIPMLLKTFILPEEHLLLEPSSTFNLNIHY